MAKANEKRKIYIFDTTLRDGEQSPGASMNDHEKVQMALQLERLGVDVIEAGFPVASEQEFASVKKVAAIAMTTLLDKRTPRGSRRRERGRPRPPAA